MMFAVADFSIRSELLKQNKLATESSQAAGMKYSSFLELFRKSNTLLYSFIGQNLLSYVFRTLVKDNGHFETQAGLSWL